MLLVGVGILGERTRFAGFRGEPRSRVVRAPVPPTRNSAHSSIFNSSISSYKIYNRDTIESSF